MTPDILEKPKYPDVDVQLVGEDGNAFAILGICYRAAQQQGVPAEEVKAFICALFACFFDWLLINWLSGCCEGGVCIPKWV